MPAAACCTLACAITVVQDQSKKKKQRIMPSGFEGRMHQLVDKYYAQDPEGAFMPLNNDTKYRPEDADKFWDVPHRAVVAILEKEFPQLTNIERLVSE
jgi:hypothetical protein